MQLRPAFASLIALGLLCANLVQRPVAGASDAPHPARETADAGNSPRLDGLGDPLPAGASVRLGTTRWRHRSDVYFVALSPDGTRLASSCSGGFTRLWETPSGRELHTFADAGRWTASALAFSPDGSRLAMIQEGGKVRLYEVPAGKLIREWAHPTDNGGQMFGLVFLSDGGALATVGGQSVRVWNANDGTERHRVDAPEGELFTEAIAVSSAGSRLAVVTDAGRVLGLDPATGATATLVEQAHTGRIGGVCFTPDGNTLITGGAGEPRRIGLPAGGGIRVGFTTAEIRFWDVTQGTQSRELRPNTFDSGTGPIAVTPDGRILVTAHHEQIRIWDMESGKVTWEIASLYNGSGMLPTSLAISPDGKLIAAGNAHAVQVWTLDGKPHLPDIDGHVRSVSTVQMAPAEGTVLTAAMRGESLRVWNAATGEFVRRIEFTSEGSSGLEAVAIAPDARTIVAGGGHRISRAGGAMEFRGELRFWDVADASRRDLALSDVIGSVVWSPDGRLLAGITRNLFSQGRPWGAAEKILLIDAATRERRAELAGHEGEIVGAAFVDGGETLLSLGADGSVRGWKIPSGEELGTVHLPGERKRPLAQTAFSPDGALVAACEMFGDTIVVWNLRTQQEQLRIRVPDTLGNHLAISPDGRLLASACQPITRSHDRQDESVYVWDLRDGKRVARFDALDGATASLAFSPNSRQLLSGTCRGTVLLWDVSEAKPQEAPAD